MTALLLAACAWAWPTAPAAVWTVAVPPGRRRWSGRPGGTATLAAVAGGLALLSGLFTASPVVGLAAALFSATIGGLIRSVLRSRRDARDRTEVLDALHALGREVHAGADLDSAIEAVRRTRGAVAVELLGRLQAGGVDTGGPSPPDVVGTELALSAAVRLSRRFGAPLAVLLTGVADGLADEQRAIEQRSSAVAGARLSGWVLAGLPLMGVLLGAGMGADPIPVLFGGGLGSGLLLVGTALLCVGLLWSARIAR